MQKQLQKQEAIERMKMLNILQPTINEFEQDDIVNKSEKGGKLCWLDDKEKELVSSFEARYGALVYHVIHNYTEFGELYSLLYVSEHKNEWGKDRRDLKEGYPFVYVKNMDVEYFSEFGSIGVKMQFGGLIRTA